MTVSEIKSLRKIAEERRMPERRTHDAVSIDIAASPERVYELVSDITRMGDWSPECYSCSWTKGATGPVVGARFKAKNRGGRGPSWSNTPKVIAADPNREFAFNRSGFGVGSYTWRFLVEPTDAGTRLTESFTAERPLGTAMTWLTMKWTGSPDRDADLHEGMLSTLARIRAAAEST
jgi:uncharacterized protein YndB with AHSA1/START domain